MSVTICYPTTAAVPGSGGFYSWGTITSGDAINAAHVDWTAASSGPMRVNGISSTAPGPNDWAYRFDGVATNIQVTLTIEATSGNYPVSFTCVGGRGPK